jgi:CRP-like cAMP-binding protein
MQPKSIFTSAAAEEAKNVSSSELSNMQRIFTTFDADGSNTIDVFELGHVMAAMGHTLTQEQLIKLVDEVSPDPDCQAIDFTQFVQLINIWKDASQFRLFEDESASLQIGQSLVSKLLLPDSYTVLGWQAVVATCLIYNFFIILYLLTLPVYGGQWPYNSSRSMWLELLLPMDIIVSVIFAADIFATCVVATRCDIGSTLPLGARLLAFFKGADPSHHTATRRYVLVDDVAKVMSDYALQGTLLVDLLAVVPFHQLILTDTWLAALTLIALLKTPKLRQMFRRSGRKQLTPRYVYIHFYLIPAVLVAVGFALTVHALAVGWTLMSFTIADRAPVSGGKGIQIDISYTNSLYFVLYTLTTCGFGDVTVEGQKRDENALRVSLTCVLCICSTLMNGLVIGSIVTILSKTDVVTERKNKLRDTLAVCEYFDVPRQLTEEILNLQNHVLTENLSDTYKTLMAHLPNDMQLTMSLFPRIRVVRTVPLFRAAQEHVNVAISQELRSQIYLPEEVIVFAGEVSPAMYFVSYGFADVALISGEPVGIVARGDYFSEGSLYASQHRSTKTVKAITYCDILILNRSNFVRVLGRFQKFRSSVMRESQRRLVSHKTHVSAGGGNPAPGEAALMEASTESLANVNAVGNSTEDSGTANGGASRPLRTSFWGANIGEFLHVELEALASGIAAEQAAVVQEQQHLTAAMLSVHACADLLDQLPSVAAPKHETIRSMRRERSMRQPIKATAKPLPSAGSASFAPAGSVRLGVPGMSATFGSVNAFDAFDDEYSLLAVPGGLAALNASDSARVVSAGASQEETPPRDDE